MSMKTDHSKVEMNTHAVILEFTSSKNLNADVIAQITKETEALVSDNESALDSIIKYSGNEIVFVIEHLSDEGTEEHWMKIIQKNFNFLVSCE